MKVTDLKKIIKEAVKEAFRDEMKDLLLEAIKGNKESNFVGKVSQSSPPPKNLYNPPSEGPDKEQIRNLFLEMQQKNGGTVGEFRPVPIDTTAEGSALPEGEVSLDQISKLINPR